MNVIDHDLRWIFWQNRFRRVDDLVDLTQNSEKNDLDDEENQVEDQRRYKRLHRRILCAVAIHFASLIAVGGPKKLCFDVNATERSNLICKQAGVNNRVYALEKQL